MTRVWVCLLRSQRGKSSLSALGRACLEALPVHDRRTRLIILLLGDPHLLECRERGEDGSSDPDRVLPLWRSNDLDLHYEGARAVISFCILSAIPGYIVVPPDRTVLAYRSFLISTSHFMIEL